MNKPQVNQIKFVQFIEQGNISGNINAKSYETI